MTAIAAALTDDRFENNDTFATATNLGSLSGTTSYSNLVMADADDYYKFTIRLHGASSSNVSLSFLHNQGDIDVRLYNSAGQLLKTSQGTTNQETMSLSGLAAGTYHVRVYGYRGVTNPNYSMSINAPGATTTPPPQQTSIDLLGAQLNATDGAYWGTSISVASRS